MMYFTPDFYAPDEQPHFKYIQFLAEERALPVQVSVTDAPTNDWEYYQPPLYYAVLTPIVFTASGNQDAGYLLVRLRIVSILLSIATFFLALKILDHLQIRDTFVRAFSLSMIFLLPTYTFLSSVLNNDNLLVALGALILYFLAKGRSTAHSLLLGALVGLALLTKLSAVVYLVAIIALFVLEAARRSLTVRAAIRHTAFVLAPAAVIYSPWLLRNSLIYGNLTGESVANVLKDWPAQVNPVVFTARYMAESFWSASGIQNNIALVPQIGVFLSCLAIAALLWAFAARRRLLAQMVGSGGHLFLLAALLAIAANFALVFRFGILYAQGQGRLLYPMLIPISILTAIGLRSLGSGELPLRSHTHSLGFFATYLLAFTGYSVGIFVGF